MSLADLHRLPRPALVLGLGGLIPLYAALAGCWLLPVLESVRALQALVGYGAVILSFLGGIQWGLALAGHGAGQGAGQGGAAGPDQRQASLGWVRLGWSIFPALLAWVSLLAGDSQIGLGILAAGFAIQMRRDIQSARLGWMPAWFLPLRRVLTIGVLLALLAAALRLALPVA
jgi:hypothetical protein